MLRVRSEERISWESLIINPIFAKPVELGKQPKKQQPSFRDTLEILFNYLKNFLVKSYLIIDANSEVSFAPNDQPLEDPTKSEDQLIVE